jgi:hypothetical protein
LNNLISEIILKSWRNAIHWSSFTLSVMGRHLPYGI